MLPLLAVLQLGFSFNLSSNYYARFSYIAAMGLAVLYHLAVRRKFVFPAVSRIFIVVAIVGGLKGMASGQLNREFLAHAFYCAMPIVMTSYGWYFMAAHEHSAPLRRRLKTLMVGAFYVGAVASAAFVLGARLGLAAYDALGLWNFFFAGPYLAYRARGVLYFAGSILGAIVTAKRSTLVVFVAYAGMFFLLLKRRTKRITFLVAPVAVVAGLFMLGDTSFLVETRLWRSVEYLKEGDIDAASANRWAESASAIRALNERWDHVLLGAGFGATFRPWPDKAGYEDYSQHYTHFGTVSYVWLGGILAPLAIYAVLVATARRLYLKAKRRQLRRQAYVFPMWLAGILTVSLLGAVLMNNSYLWFVIGCCLRLDESTPQPTT